MFSQSLDPDQNINPHPVDSTTRTCCRGIGRHTAECPVALLNGSASTIDALRGGLNAALRALPDDVPLFAVVDLVTALGHLRLAAIMIDRAADALNAEVTL